MTSLNAILDKIEESKKVEGTVEVSTKLPHSCPLSSQEPEEVLPNIDAHGYLQGVYRGQIKPNGSRLRAAIASLPFERPKLGVMVQVSGQDLADRLMHALQASGRVIEGRAVQVIEGPKTDAGLSTGEDLPDHSKPFAQNSKHRFRRF